MNMDYNTFAALAEPHRFDIVELLRNGPRPVNEISLRLKLDQPQTSKHLKILADAGVVDVRPMKQKRVYALSPEKFEEMDEWIKSFRKVMEERFQRLDKLLAEEMNSTR